MRCNVGIWQMTYVKGNLFTFEESAVAVNTGVQSVRTVDAYDQFIDLGISPDNPFKISYPTSVSNVCFVY